MSEDRRTAWGFSLFCDDIRHEVGQKMTAVGIYQADIAFPGVQFPLIYPKLCILVKYFELPGTYSGERELLIYFPGDEQGKPTVRQSIPQEAFPLGDSAPPPEDDQERIISMTAPIALSPLHLKQEGYLKVRMRLGKRIVTLGSLHVRLDGEEATPSEAADAPS